MRNSEAIPHAADAELEGATAMGFSGWIGLRIKTAGNIVQFFIADFVGGVDLVQFVVLFVLVRHLLSLFCSR